MNGLELILAERERQINVEGYDSLHDSHYSDELVRAANCYKHADWYRFKKPNEIVPINWPWAISFWKPTPDDRVRELTKAGALYKADYDLHNNQESYDLMQQCVDGINELINKIQP